MLACLLISNRGDYSIQISELLVFYSLRMFGMIRQIINLTVTPSQSPLSPTTEDIHRNFLWMVSESSLAVLLTSGKSKIDGGRSREQTANTLR